jgi:hypothetical protein
MKKILKPATQEIGVLYSDFNGKLFFESTPEVEIKLIFNYGSPFDGECLTLDLTNEEAEPILELIKSKISKDKKQDITKSTYSALSKYFNHE